jgi:hypothetical protein
MIMSFAAAHIAAPQCGLALTIETSADRPNRHHPGDRARQTPAGHDANRRLDH